MEFTPNSNSYDGGFAINPNSSGGAGAAGGFFDVATSDGSGDYSVGTFTRPSVAAWHFYSFTIDRSTPSHQIDQGMYLDGVNQTVQFGSSTSGINNFPNSTLYLMSRAGSSLLGTGILDELRLSNTRRSAAWIATEYNNQSSPTSFYSVSGPTSSGAAVTPTFSPGAGTYTSAAECHDPQRRLLGR